MGYENGLREVAMQTKIMQEWDPKFGVLSWSLNHITESTISDSISLGFCLSWSRLSTREPHHIGSPFHDASSHTTVLKHNEHL